MRLKPKITTLAALLCLCAFSWSSVLHAAPPSEVFPLWPRGEAPGETRAQGEEHVLQGRRRPFYQLTDISVPTVSVFLPPAEKRTGSAVLVCPGGGLQRLAYEHEGLEIADWLNPLGITVFVLKYRVPAPAMTGLMDVQRAMGMIRQRAEAFRIDAEKISVMGFSAGGEIAALLATQHETRAYPPIDDADRLPCRPTNVCLVYPGGIARRNGDLRQDIGGGLHREKTPSMFIVHAFDDASHNSLALAQALKRVGVASEIHIYQAGGHGFGARDSTLPLNSWKTRYLEWLSAYGFFEQPFVGAYARQLFSALVQGGALPRLSGDQPDAQVADAFAVQRHVVNALLRTETMAGFKGGASNAAAQQALGINHPLSGVLFRSGWIDAGNTLVMNMSDAPEMVVETELGFIISRGVDISYRLTSIEHTKGAVEAIVPVIELPNQYQRWQGGESGVVDVLASNVGAARYIVGQRRTSPDDVNPDAVQITLKRDTSVLHQTSAGLVKGGQWGNLMTLINQLVDQGHTIRSGHIIICGALGEVHPAVAGQYRADYGPLGSIGFALR